MISVQCDDKFEEFGCATDVNGTQSCFLSFHLKQSITAKAKNIKIDENFDQKKVLKYHANPGITMNYFPANFHKLFKNLEEIYALNVDLLEVTKKDLQNLQNLRVLDLRGNKLSILEVNLFAGNPRLEVIYLDSNDFNQEALDVRPFLNLANLTHLSIFNNIFKQSQRCPSVYCIANSTVEEEITEKMTQTASTSPFEIIYGLCAFSITQLVIILFMCLTPRRNSENSTDNEVKVVTREIDTNLVYDTWPKKQTTDTYEELENEVFTDYAEVGFNSKVDEKPRVLLPGN